MTRYGWIAFAIAFALIVLATAAFLALGAWAGTSTTPAPTRGTDPRPRAPAPRHPQQTSRQLTGFGRHTGSVTTQTTPEARLLVVEDEPNIRELLATSLRYAGFDVATAANGTEALKIAGDHHPDLCVLDVMLPDMDGFTVTRRLREQGRQLPIVFVTARDSVDDKIKGLTVGGDDYVTKPFSLEEVVARIRAVLRRTRGDAEEDRHVMSFEDLELDEDSHEVRRAGRVIETSPTEFKLLRYLMLNPNRVLSKAQILDHVWDYDFRGEAGIVESYISYLRRKIDAEGLPAADPHQARRRLRPAAAPSGLMARGPGAPVRLRHPVRSTASSGGSRRCPCGGASSPSWAPSSGAALVLTSLSTAYLMRSDLMERVDAELQAGRRSPSPARPCADLSQPGTAPARRATPSTCRATARTLLRLPTGATSTPVLPDLPLDDPRVTSGEPFTVPSEGGRPEWRFIAGRVVGERRDLRRRRVP